MQEDIENIESKIDNQLNSFDQERLLQNMQENLELSIQAKIDAVNSAMESDFDAVNSAMESEFDAFNSAMESDSDAANSTMEKLE